MSKFITPKELAQELNMSPEAVRVWVKNKRIKATRTPAKGGGKIMIPLSEVKNLIK